MTDIAITQARIAVYDDLLSAPRVIDIQPAPILEYIEAIATTTYEYARQLGGKIPYTVIREVAENFIHAQFKECTVSVLEGGNTLRFSDQGPGIERKTLVVQPGITSATAAMKQYIKGVGSGFPIVKEYLETTSGYLSIDDNAVDGTVVTLQLGIKTQPTPFIQAPSVNEQNHQRVPLLSSRDQQALLLIKELGIVGPSDIALPLGISIATAHRVLTKLEAEGLIEVSNNRKRILSNLGVTYIKTL
jgi:anti-sigma regulatory factor (Ser/Thr protein kinase)